VAKTVNSYVKLNILHNLRIDFYLKVKIYI